MRSWKNLQRKSLRRGGKANAPLADMDCTKTRDSLCLLIAAGVILFCFATWTGKNADAQADPRATALTLEQRGDDAGAEAAWRSYLAAHPERAEAYAHLGLLEARRERYKEAIADDRKALALHPGLPGLRLNLGLALFKSGAMKEAAQEFLAEWKATPATSAERQQLTILLGMSYYGMGAYAEAAPYLKQAADRDKRNLPLRMALAHSYLWSKQYQKVLDTYQEILLLNPESAEADMLAGEALDEMKDITGAIAQFRAAAKVDPKMPDVHFGLGYLLWTKRRYVEAAPEFQAELENDPGHAQAMTYLADCDLELSHPEIARPLLEKAIQLDPTIELAELDLGSIDADAGRSEDALRELEHAGKLAPADVNVHWKLGRLYRTMGKNAEARAEFDKAKNITQAADAALVEKLTPHPAAQKQAATPESGK